MVISCAALNCTHKFGDKDKEGKLLTFHKFPLGKPQLCCEWMIAVNREDFFPSRHHALCSEHFKVDDFYRNYVHVRRLKPDAIPSIFDSTKRVKPKRTYKKRIKEKDKVENDAAVENNISTSKTVEITNDILGDNDNNKSQAEAQSQNEDITAQNTTSETPKNPETKRPKLIKYTVTVLNSKLNSIPSNEFMDCNSDPITKVGAPKISVDDTSKPPRSSPKPVKKIKSLRELLEHLQTKDLITDDTLRVLRSCDSDLFDDLTKRKKKRSRTYSLSFKQFASTLYFNSSDAYKYLREDLNMFLPLEDTLYEFYDSSDASPGFTFEAFERIRKNHSKTCTVYCSLSFTQMQIRKHVEWDEDSFRGIVNFGSVLTEHGLENREAREVFVLMAVDVNASFKIPIGYFLVTEVGSSERKTIVEIAMRKLHEVSVIVVAVCCQGVEEDFEMAKKLGAKLDLTDMNPFFPHPVTNGNVYIIFDPCYLIGSLRNIFANSRNLNLNKTRLSWKYIEELREFLKKEKFKFTGEHNLIHLNFGNQPIDVKLAQQVLSSSVGNAISYLINEKHEQFQGAESTAEFCVLFDKLFDVFNSKNRLAKYFKAGISESNKIIWETFLNQMEIYLQAIKDENGNLMSSGYKKFAILGLLAVCKSTKGLYNDLVKSKKFDYLLMYTFSLDHLHMFFSTVMSKCKDNNPTSVQFRNNYRILIQNESQTSYDPICYSNTRRFQGEFCGINSSKRDKHLILLPDKISEYSTNVVLYIAGFVVRIVVKSVNCNTCADCLFRKSGGALILPSESVLRICKEAEKHFKMFTVYSKLLKRGVDKIVIDAVTNLMDLNVFPELDEHILDNLFPFNHWYRLVRLIIETYVDLRSQNSSSDDAKMNLGVVKKVLSANYN
ncbi:hypothetical protein CHUAL_014023 [Chamberlinius hualienensis]